MLIKHSASRVRSKIGVKKVSKKTNKKAKKLKKVINRQKDIGASAVVLQVKLYLLLFHCFCRIPYNNFNPYRLYYT